MLTMALDYGGANTALNLTSGGSTADQVTISQVNSTLRIDLGSDTFAATSSTGVAGMVYSVAGQPNQSTFAEV